MNYYEHHIGDYAQATAHLSFLEDAAYSRLLRKYYGAEAPLPKDVKQVQRLVGARLPPEKEAVEVVLAEFFTEEADGWHNRRADEEIAAYQEKTAAEAAKRKNTTERQQRNRDRRSAMFAELAKHGIKPRWNAPMKELEAHLSRVTGRDGGVEGSTPATDLLRRSSPVSSLQSPYTSKDKSVCDVTGVTDAAGTGPPETPPSAQASPPPEDPHARWLAVRAAYPKHTHGEHDWMLAQREAERAVDDGLCTWDQWFNAATRYASQVRATGREGTQYVTKPSNWFKRDKCSWRQEFSLPAAPKTNGNGRPKFIPAPDPDEIERMTAQGKTWTPDNGWTPA